MKFTILTIFPQIIEAYFADSIMAKAVERNLINYRIVNIRDYALDKHHKCDDAPYGGGAGMLMLAEPIGRALEAIGVLSNPQLRVIYPSPSGQPFSQAMARELASQTELVLLCGRYEGIDQRVIDRYVDNEVSVGDYVLSSGEVAALVLIDTVYRLVPAVITAESLAEESFHDGLLEYPQYTRPEIYANLRVPEILLSGHHEHIRRWRLRQRVSKTWRVRPDLIQRGLSAGWYNAETIELIKELESTAKLEVPGS